MPQLLATPVGWFCWLRSIALFLTLVLLNYAYNNPLLSTATSTPKCNETDLSIAPTIQIEPLPASTSFRSTILDYGARVACYPSTGGIWIKHAVPVELDFLVLSRSEDTKRPWPARVKRGKGPDEGDMDYTEEDIFCERMRMVGAEFWDLSHCDLDAGPAYIRQYIPPQARVDLSFAWPGMAQDYCFTNGAWLVNLSVAREYHGAGLKGWNNILSMDERSRIAKDIGALYCPIQSDMCKAMWCAQYPTYCHEWRDLSRHSQGGLWPCQGKYWG